MAEAVGVFGDYLPMRSRARLLGGLLVAAAVSCWMAVGFDVADFRLLGRELGGAPVSDGQKAAYAQTGQVLAALQWLLLVAAGATFVEWVYQSRVNLRAFGVRRLRYRRGWAVAGFLIPALNLIRPYQVMREVWKASDPRIQDPFAWTRAPIGWLLPLWWGACVLWALLVPISLGMAASAGPDAAKLQAARGVALAADLTAALGVSLAWFVVEHVSEAQSRKWDLGRSG